jgi:serine/threonine protein kinase
MAGGGSFLERQMDQFFSGISRGGQGTVYKARSPQKVAAASKARNELRDSITRITNIDRISPRPDENTELDHLISSVKELVRSDDISTEVGALKVFDIPTDGSAGVATAVHRFEREVEALQSIHHPGILKLKDANIGERWLVSEYHSGGTLADHQSRYEGNALSALTAFRSIVEAVAELHQKGYVHRDIKSNNVFIANDGGLVLGDFGIVFFKDQDRTRLTEEDERVGTRDWMAPWAHTGIRVDDVTPTFDVFPLGKLLWVMISGRRILPPYRTHASNGFKLEEMFPGQPGMEQINSILDKCIVMEETDCLPSAEPLKQMVESAIQALGQTATLEQITLATPKGDFRVRLSLTPFQVVATPLRRNEKGEWVALQGNSTESPIARWQVLQDGTFIRMG